MKTMVWEFCEGVMLLVHGEHPPTDAEWSRYMEVYTKTYIDGLKGSVVFTDGTGPNASQRALIREQPRLREIPVAVVTQSLAARGMVTAVSWFGHRIRAFSPERIEEAFAFSGLAQERWDTAMTSVAKMRSTLLSSHTLRETGERLALPEDVDLRDYVILNTLADMRKRMEEIRDRMERFKT